MREIKFRVWDRERKRWLPNTGNPYIFPFEGRVAMKCAGDATGHIGKEDYSEFYELVQYTGLKDKNGREIYEGDIVKASDFYLGDSFVKASRGEVIFDNGAFCVKAPTESIGDLNSEAISNYQVEVIGNIYEPADSGEK